MPRTPTIAALGGGGFSMEPDDPRLDRWLLSLTGARRPRVCFVATASGDAEGYLERFHAAFAALSCEATHLALFRREIADLRAFVLAQDLVYVGGGNTANLLAVWRTHGLDAILREAWAAGVVLAGLSAGALCWFEGGVTDSFGPGYAPLVGGLGLLPGSFCPHYDGEAERRPLYRRLVAEGALAAGIAADDSVAVCFTGTARAEVVTSRPGARAWVVTPHGETPLVARPLDP